MFLIMHRVPDNRAMIGGQAQEGLVEVVGIELIDQKEEKVSTSGRKLTFEFPFSIHYKVDTLQFAKRTSGVIHPQDWFKKFFVTAKERVAFGRDQELMALIKILEAQQGKEVEVPFDVNSLIGLKFAGTVSKFNEEHYIDWPTTFKENGVTVPTLAELEGTPATPAAPAVAVQIPTSQAEQPDIAVKSVKMADILKGTEDAQETSDDADKVDNGDLNF